MQTDDWMLRYTGKRNRWAKRRMGYQRYNTIQYIEEKKRKNRCG